MSLNVLNPRVGDIMGVSSKTIDAVEFPIGRFIVLRKDRFKPSDGGYDDRKYTCRLLWQKSGHFVFVGDNTDGNFEITLGEMINSYNRFYLHYRPEEK
jgi:hypothetical protein|tara:strand:- start:814 stop:1107 length:294 start_codon:yes stop_codon:yes gene_type:complete